MELADVDLYDPDNFVEAVPHEMLAALRREAPVFKHPHPTDGGYFWCITKHADLIEVNRDTKRFSSQLGGTNIDTPFGDGLEQARLMMLNQDPPAHERLRRIVSRGFTPRRIREMHGLLETRARAIVDDIAPRGACDFVQDVAMELPLQVIADLLGVPEPDRRKLFEWSNTLIGFDDPEFQHGPDDAMAAAGEIFAYAQGLADERRANPQDDIVDSLLNAEIDGEHLTDMEFNMFFLLLSVAGNETTRNAISHGMKALIEFPDQRQLLLDDPSLLNGAIEEILRWATPVMYFRRTAAHDTTIRGQEIAEGDRVVIWHMSANRDEEVFDDPFAFDIRRNPNPHAQHIAFGGGGPHFCLGANLARAEMQVMFRELLARIPDMEITGPVDRLRSNFVNGIKRMPVAYTPVAA